VVDAADLDRSTPSKSLVQAGHRVLKAPKEPVSRPAAHRDRGRRGARADLRLTWGERI
jgi:hypothetical protein